jgi:hypothetical protein
MEWCLSAGIFYDTFEVQNVPLASSCLSVCLFACNNSRTAIRVVKKCIVRTFQFLLNSETKMNENLHSYLASTREIVEYLLRKNVSNKSCREKLNTHFVSRTALTTFLLLVGVFIIHLLWFSSFYSVMRGCTSCNTRLLLCAVSFMSTFFFLHTFVFTTFSLLFLVILFFH